MAIRWYSAERLTKATGTPHTEGRWIDLSTLPPPGPSAAPMVMTDVQPYRSVVTGEMIGGRRQHREHLKSHGLIEIGNEKLTPRAPEVPKPGAIVSDIKRAIEQGPPPEMKAALQRAQHALD